MDRQTDIEWFKGFVVDSHWRFAKTYVESYPHEYMLERRGDDEAFRRAILCIEHWGVPETFWNARRKYLYVDHRKYWHMGDAYSETAGERPTLINRTWLDVAQYRDHAKNLGYDGDVLERLVVQWNELLEKAKRGT